MATAEQVETLMEGLSMLDVHLQVPRFGVQVLGQCCSLAGNSSAHGGYLTRIKQR